MTAVNGTGDGGSRLRLFSTLWALHVLFHYASYASFFVSPLALCTVVAALFLLFKPGSPARLAVSGYLYALTWFAHIPNGPNHETLGALVSFTFAGALIAERWRTGPGFDAGRALERGAPVIRSIVLLMYFWATLHKINTDFLFAEQVSCGADFYRAFLDRFPFLPASSGWLNLTMAWATVLVEGLLGVLLLVPRTRGWGIAAAWAFHWMLTLNPKSGFYNFTSMLFLLFLAFAPSGIAPALAAVWRDSRPRALALRLMSAERWRALPRLLLWGALLAVPVFLIDRHSLAGLFGDLQGWFSAHRVWVRTMAFRVWMVWSVPLSLYVWWAFRRLRRDTPAEELRWGPGSWRAVPRPLLLVVPFLFFWGLTPYLGLKTENSVAMFSNLRTEVEANHLMIPEALKVFPYQDDRVRVISVVGRDADGSKLRLSRKRRRYEVPYEGFRGWLRTRMRYGAEIEEVTYRRNGETVVERFEDGGEVFNQGMLAHKFLQFRWYRPKGPMTCEH